jgi:DNA-binding NarL/FixJ family response regulator
MEPARIRLILADDHAAILDEIRQHLAGQFEIARCVASGTALIDAVADLHPDVVVCDINMPGMSGIDAGKQIIHRGLCGSIVLLTMYNEPHLIRRALRAGIRGYVLKVDAGEELAAAVIAVWNGGRYLSREALAHWEDDDAEDQSSSRG